MSWDLVVFLDADWDMYNAPKRQHFLIQEIASQIEGKGKILALERPICPVTGPFQKGGKFLDWLFGRRRLRQEAPNLFLYTPFVWLHNVLASTVSGMTKANNRLLRWQVNQLLEKLGFRQESLVAWIHHPYQLEDIGLVEERLLVYDCYDYYLSHAKGWKLNNLQQREKAILALADIVFVISEPLLEKVRNCTQKVYLVPNGVDVGFFGQALRAETLIPSEIAALSHPVVGFVGKIADWLDFELLSWLVKAHPQWSFAFIGMNDGDWKLSSHPCYRLFKQAPNVYLFGPKPYVNLPGYLKGFDVCIIPYLLDEQVLASSPRKLYEYLASGKPVVSIDIPHVAGLQPFVRVAKNTNEFERAILISLSKDSEPLRKQRLVAAQKHSWRARAKQVISTLEKHL